MGFHTVLAHLQETDEIITALALYDSINDAIHDQKVQNTISDLQIRYETEKKEHEIERQQHIIARQNMQRGLLVGGIAVNAVILLLLWYMLNLRTRRNRALTERNEALSEMNATKDKFFSIISHDLKNPAVAQRDALQLLVKNARLWDADTLTDYYHQLLESAEGEVELIFNLLGWAQIQTGRLTCTPGTFDISNVMPNLSLITGICNNKGITLVTQIPKDVLITCDNNMISTVIRNLLTNAVKFTPAGGTVTLLVEHTGSPLRQKIRITITDTGIGMNREQINQLFRLDSKQSREGTAGEQGSGLGLIVCSELLGKQGSTLQVESEEGKGSKFWFEV
jgi:signal transduction histidine kinase